MKHLMVKTIVAALLGVVFTAELHAQTTDFTYQGRLSENGGPAAGSYDLRFELFDSPTEGLSLGAVTNAASAVAGGLFTVKFDFGSSVFDGSERWLEIGARTNGGPGFTTLNPRQRITPTPYALRALSLGEAGLEGVYTGAVSLANPANAFAGSFTGEGAGLTALDASQLLTGTVPDARLGASVSLLGPSITSSEITDGTITAADVDAASFNTTFWRVNGNAGTTADFLGTTDNQPVELRVNNQPGLRLEYPTVGTVPNLVGGFSGNSVGAGTEGAVIAGGGSFANPNSIGMDSHNSAIGGGRDNNIAFNSAYATIAGGQLNDIGMNSEASAIGGGWGNYIASQSAASTIAGGYINDIGVNSFASAIGGGDNNIIASNSVYVTIAGGYRNDIGVNSDASAIGGGWANNIGVNSFASAIGGGHRNIIASNASYAVIPGGRDNDVGANASYAFAAGRRAKANHQGAFVWADSTLDDLASTADNQLVVRASGGMDIYSASTLASLSLRANYLANPPSWALSISQNQNSTMTISNGGTARVTLLSNGRVGIGNINPTQLLQVGNATCNGTSWNNASDRNLKDNIQTIEPREVLERLAALPVSRWNYKTQPGATHLGPMAQDFSTAFGLGEDDKHIATVDADGVALAAIQGLNEKVEGRSQNSELRMQRIEAENAALKSRLEKLERFLSQNNGGAN